MSDQRERKSIPLFNIVMPVLLFLMLQYESFHTVFSAPESMSKRLRNCIIGKIIVAVAIIVAAIIIAQAIGGAGESIRSSLLKLRDAIR